MVYLRFEVADTKIGMSEEFMKRIFQPFEQQDRSTSSRFGGTGLGLSISRSLVTLMQGTIRAASKPDRGSVFTVELPFEQDRDHLADAARSSDFSKIHALVVDDERNACEYIALLLNRCGVRNDTYFSGQDAVDAFISAQERGDGYNLCLVDWKMPDMDGYTATRRIRASSHPEAKTIPILAMTANAFTEDVVKAISEGMNDHIANPIETEELFGALKRAIKR